MYHPAKLHFGATVKPRSVCSGPNCVAGEDASPVSIGLLRMVCWPCPGISRGIETAGRHMFVKHDPHLESDADFGVKPKLIVEFNAVDAGDTQWRSEFDFVLKRS